MNERLDAILRCLNKAYNDNNGKTKNYLNGQSEIVPIEEMRYFQYLNFKQIYDWIIENEKMAIMDLSLALSFLIKKEMIIWQKIESKDKYAITFEGRELIMGGGYTNQIRQNKKKKQNAVIREYFLIVGSLLAGIGTILLFSIEIIKHFCWND